MIDKIQQKWVTLRIFSEKLHQKSIAHSDEAHIHYMPHCLALC